MEEAAVSQQGLIPSVPKLGPLPTNLHGQTPSDKANPFLPHLMCELINLGNAITGSQSSIGGLPGLCSRLSSHNLHQATSQVLQRTKGERLPVSAFSPKCLQED